MDYNAKTLVTSMRTGWSAVSVDHPESQGRRCGPCLVGFVGIRPILRGSIPYSWVVRHQYFGYCQNVVWRGCCQDRLLCCHWEREWPFPLRHRIVGYIDMGWSAVSVDHPVSQGRRCGPCLVGFIGIRSILRGSIPYFWLVRQQYIGCCQSWLMSGKVVLLYLSLRMAISTSSNGDGSSCYGIIGSVGR